MNELLDSLPCGVMSCDDTGTIHYANATLGDMLGHAADSLAGRSVETLLTVASRIFFQTHLFPLLQLRGRADELFVLFRSADGRDVATLCNAVRHTREGATVTDFSVVEVRERRKYEAELLRARREAEQANRRLVEQARELELGRDQLQEQATALEMQSEELGMLNDQLILRTEELEQSTALAEKANRAKSEFLAVMSHELRTPLNAIGGYVQLLELEIYGPMTEEQRGALDRVGRNQRHLLGLINDVLNLARIESGRVEYHPEDIVLQGLLEDLSAMIQPQIGTKAQQYGVELVDAALQVRADREKLSQIMLNLLSNAVKFTPRGGRITVSATFAPDGGAVIVDVADTGLGIPAEKLATIFDPFVQVRSDSARDAEGAGLGLAISRDLARGMGGELTVRSVLGTGSTFSLRLPAA